MANTKESIVGARELFRSGRLGEAVAAAALEVKERPSDVGVRAFLSGLLSFAGDMDRADRQLQAIGELDPGSAVGVALLRRLLRAEMARRQVFGEGRLPQFLAPPSEDVRLRLEAIVALRAGQGAAAVALLEKAESARAAVPGSLNGQPFDDFRDLDDLTASVFETLTSNGDYYWIPLERVELAEFRKPAGPHDLLWRPVHMIVRDGPDGEVYLPVLYPGTHESSDDRLRLGRATDWRGGDGSPVRGVGQRVFLAGEGDVPILQVEKIEFAARAAGAA